MGMNETPDFGRSVALCRRRHSDARFSLWSRLWPAFALALLLMGQGAAGERQGSAAERFRVSAVDTDQAGTVSVVVRLPSYLSLIPKASDFRLLEDGEATSTAGE